MATGRHKSTGLPRRLQITTCAPDAQHANAGEPCRCHAPNDADAAPATSNATWLQCLTCHVSGHPSCYAQPQTPGNTMSGAATLTVARARCNPARTHHIRLTRLRRAGGNGHALVSCPTAQLPCLHKGNWLLGLTLQVPNAQSSREHPGPKGTMARGRQRPTTENPSVLVNRSRNWIGTTLCVR